MGKSCQEFSSVFFFYVFFARVVRRAARPSKCGAWKVLLGSVADHCRQLPVGEAGLGAGVAGSAYLVDLDQQCIAIAIDGYGLHELVMAGGIALTPIFLAGARVEGDSASSQRAVQGF